MDLEEIGVSAGNWVVSAQDRNYWRALVYAALNLRVPQAMELLSSLTVDIRAIEINADVLFKVRNDIGLKVSIGIIKYVDEDVIRV